MARYFWYRSKFFVHVFQQMGYKHNEYWQWLREHWEQKVIPGALAFFSDGGNGHVASSPLPFTDPRTA